MRIIVVTGGIGSGKSLASGILSKEFGWPVYEADSRVKGLYGSDPHLLYNVNKKKLPAGLKGLSERLHSIGLAFGLWFEPESVNVDSDLYRAHPDWALTDEHSPVFGRHQLLLDLTKPEVRDYIVENVSKILDEACVSYVKWDMNRHSIALGTKAHEFILGNDTFNRIGTFGTLHLCNLNELFKLFRALLEIHLLLPGFPVNGSYQAKQFRIPFLFANF